MIDDLFDFKRPIRKSVPLLQSGQPWEYGLTFDWVRHYEAQNSLVGYSVEQKVALEDLRTFYRVCSFHDVGGRIRACERLTWSIRHEEEVKRWVRAEFHKQQEDALIQGGSLIFGEIGRYHATGKFGSWDANFIAARVLGVD